MTMNPASIELLELGWKFVDARFAQVLGQLVCDESDWVEFISIAEGQKVIDMFEVFCALVGRPGVFENASTVYDHAEAEDL